MRSAFAATLARVVALALLTALAGFGSTALGQTFHSERPLLPGGKGPNRAAVDVTLLTHADPVRYGLGADPLPVGGLDDLRLFDGAGRSVPFLVMLPESPTRRDVPGRVLAVASTKATSGFEVDLGTAETVDTLVLDRLAAPFLKRYRLEGSGDRSHWTLLVEEGTLFDLPAEHLREVTARFSVGTFRYLRVQWDDRNSARVAPPDGARALAAERAAPPAQNRLPLAFERSASEPRVSRFRVHLPGRNLPLAAIELDVAPGNLLRPARVLEARLRDATVEPCPLGAATLRRTAHGEAIAAALAIAVAPAEGRELELVVEDGDSGPLPLTAVWARLRPLPWIYFESTDGAPLVARFGAANVPAPHFDLEAARREVGSRALAEATWGAAVALNEQTTASAPSAGVLLGALLDTSAFRYARPVGATRPGLNSLGIDLPVLAHSRDLADLRLATADGRQVPYLLERRDGPLTIALPVRGVPTPSTAEPRSSYRLALPFPDLPPARLVLETTARVFDRTVAVAAPGVDPRAPERVLARVAWRHADPETGAAGLAIEVPSHVGSELHLLVDEGDNSPLPIASATLSLPAWRLRFFGPHEGLRLLYGNDSIGAPRYDIALLAPRLVGEEGNAVAAGPEAAVAASTPSLSGPHLFWGVLVLSVVALLLLVARLLRTGAN